MGYSDDGEMERGMKELRKIPAKRQRSGNPRISSDKSPFMGISQVLEIVPVSRSMLYLMIKSGEFPGQIKIGKRAAAWSKKEVNEWVADKLGETE